MPDLSLVALILIIIFAIALGFSNGFNDAANAVATAIGTRSLTPRQAMILAPVFNFIGAATGLAVARTIGKGLLIPEAITFPTVIGGVAAVVIWTTLATIKGMPVSITHGLVAGLAAAGIATVGSEAIAWGVLQRVLTAVVTAPVLGFAGGFIMMVFSTGSCGAALRTGYVPPLASYRYSLRLLSPTATARMTARCQLAL